MMSIFLISNTVMDVIIHKKYKTAFKKIVKNVLTSIELCPNI